MLSFVYFCLLYACSLTIVGGLVHPVPDSRSSTVTSATVSVDGTLSTVASSSSSFTPDDVLTIPSLPLQFRANITIIAHLVDKAKDYPPWRRRLNVAYDFIHKRAVTHVLEGFEVNKTFLRRWDGKQEYVYKYGDFAQCRRSYLSEPIPLPTFDQRLHRLPRSLTNVTDIALLQSFFTRVSPHYTLPLRRSGTYSIHNRNCTLYLRKDGTSRQKLYIDNTLHIPISITDEYYDTMLTPSSSSSTADQSTNSNGSGTWVPVMTYTFESIELGEPSAELFTIPLPWDHETCTRHIGGWPYIHAFHHFLRL